VMDAPAFTTVSPASIWVLGRFLAAGGGVAGDPGCVGADGAALCAEDAYPELLPGAALCATTAAGAAPTRISHAIAARFFPERFEATPQSYSARRG